MGVPPVSGGNARLPESIEVEAGGTLSEIAAENGLSLEELLELNPQFDAALVDGKLDTQRNGNSGWDPDFIRAGETLMLRASSGTNTQGTQGDVAPASFNSSSPEAMRYFQSQGWSEAQAAGIVANLQAESGLDPHIAGDGGLAYGLGQWHPDRQANFERFTGHSIRSSTFAEQLQFVQWELTHTESAAGDALKGAGSASEAAAIFCRLYERPADIAGQSQHRASLAQQISGGSQEIYA